MAVPPASNASKGEPYDKPVRKQKRRRVRSDHYVFAPEPRSKVLPYAICGGFIGAFVLCVISLLVSQYEPYFGSFDRHLEEPWGPARVALIPAHLLAFGLVGIALGTAGGAWIGFGISATKDGSRRF